MTVLSQSDVSTLGDNGWLIALFVISLLITLFFGMVVIFATMDGEGMVALTSLAIAVAFGILSYHAGGWASDTRTQYKVIIDDFNVVHEDYEIIDQEGEIYTVIKKEAK